MRKRSLDQEETPSTRPPPALREKLTNTSIRLAIQAISRPTEMRHWDVSEVTDMSGLFEDTGFFEGRGPYPELDAWDVSSVVKMSRMFYGCGIVPDISRWDVSNVTDFSQMFCKTDHISGSLAKWNVSKATNLSGMFRSSHYFDQSLENWDVSNVTDFSGMFEECVEFNQPLGKWDMSSARNLSNMFHRCRRFNQPLIHWKVEKVETLGSLFRKCVSFNQPLGEWQLLTVTDLSYVFEGCGKFNQPLEGWQVDQATSMIGMFEGCGKFNQPLGKWKVSKVFEMTHLFCDCHSFNQPLEEWDVSAVMFMSGMFCRCYAFDQPLGKWNVSNVRKMSDMFYDCRSFNQPLGDWNVTSVQQMNSMFEGCGKFNQPLGEWNVSSVVSMQAMFGGCEEFNQPLLTWNVFMVTTMKSMFSQCLQFNQPIGGWNVMRVTDMSYMFSGCRRFEQSLELWEVSKVASFSDMFSHSNYQLPLMRWRMRPDPRPSTHQMFGYYQYRYLRECEHSWWYPHLTPEEFQIRELQRQIHFLQTMIHLPYLPTRPLAPCPVLDVNLRAKVFDIREQTESSLQSSLFHPDGSPQNVFLLWVKESTTTTTTYQPMVIPKDQIRSVLFKPIDGMQLGPSPQPPEIRRKQQPQTYIDMYNDMMTDDRYMLAFWNLVFISPDRQLYLNLNIASVVTDRIISLRMITYHVHQPGITVLVESERGPKTVTTIFNHMYFGGKKTKPYTLLEMEECTLPFTPTTPTTSPATTPPPSPTNTIEVVAPGISPQTFALTDTVGYMAAQLAGNVSAPPDTVVMKFMLGGSSFWMRGNGEVDQMQLIDRNTNHYEKLQTITELSMSEFRQLTLRGDHSQRLNLTIQRTHRAAGSMKRRRRPTWGVHSHKASII